MPAFRQTSLIERGRHFSPAPRWHRLAWPLLVLISFVLISSVGYRVIEDEYTWLDAIYMTVIVLSTVGLGEVGHLSDTGRIWTIGVIALGLVTVAVVMGMLAGIIVEGIVRKILGRRQLERKIAALSGHVIVCGYGRTGEHVADELLSVRRDIVVIESDEHRIAAIESAGLLHVRGDAQEEEVLQTAGVERASALIAALSDDADNLFITLSARQANQDIRILSRAEQETSKWKLIKAGADSVICPHTICGRRMAGLILHPAVIELADMAQQGLGLEFNQLQITPGSRLAGQTLADLSLPRTTGAHVVAIRRADGEADYHPQFNTKINVGDTLVLMGEAGISETIESLQADTQD